MPMCNQLDLETLESWQDNMPKNLPGHCIEGRVRVTYNERGKLTASYRWTGRVWEITGFNFKTSRKLLLFLEEFIAYTYS
jgi:hypothetical protein